MRTNRLLLSLAVVLAASPVGAMTLDDAPLATLAAEADLIVHAQVLARTPEPVPGRAPTVRTRHQLVVWDLIAARSRPRLTLDGPLPRLDVLLPGGTLGGYTTAVPGVPTLAPGDEVLLLLTDTPWGYQPIGYALGTWHIDALGRAHRPAPAPATPLAPLTLDALTARLLQVAR
jgi:hypothetical protein